MTNARKRDAAPEAIFYRESSPLLKWKGKCSCRRAKLAHVVSHLPGGKQHEYLADLQRRVIERCAYMLAIRREAYHVALRGQSVGLVNSAYYRNWKKESSIHRSESSRSAN